MKKLEIFKPGKHTAVDGKTIDFSEDDVKASVAAYDPAAHEAPMVVGHPRMDAPAYGWVKGLEFADGTMMAEPYQVDADFAEMVNSGRFKKISASFYLPDAPGNPKPGVYSLRHVGFLGAQPPAVKGLKSASFSEAEEGIVEFGSYEDAGAQYAEGTVPGLVGQASCLSQAGSLCRHVDSGLSPDKKKEEQMKEEELKQKEDELSRKEASFAEREANLKKKEAEARHKEHISFAEGLVKEGKLLPVHKDKVAGILDFADGLESGVVEFGEGDKKTSQPVSEAFREFLAGQPKIVEFGEAAGDKGDVADSQDASAIAKAAVEFQEAEAKAGRTISITEAVNHITKGGK